MSEVSYPPPKNLLKQSSSNSLQDFHTLTFRKLPLQRLESSFLINLVLQEKNRQNPNSAKALRSDQIKFGETLKKKGF